MFPYGYALRINSFSVFGFGKIYAERNVDTTGKYS
jgi:hypothetical protein